MNENFKWIYLQRYILTLSYNYFMYSLWPQEFLLLFLISTFVLLVYNTISYFFNRETFYEKLKLSIKYMLITILVIITIFGVVILYN